MTRIAVYAIPTEGSASIISLEKKLLEDEDFGRFFDVADAGTAAYQLTVYRPGGCSRMVQFIVWRVWRPGVAEVNVWA
ncbi:hypothetical protein OH77DRAFT_108034 [Trametes cingulata]|nr:hypothetical protein OH77DRAFT_108034 [Trametes cingulata]